MAKCKCGCGQTVNKTFVKGHNRRGKAKTHSIATRKKISQAQMGKTHSIASRKKMSEAHTKDNLSIETLKKMSQASRGENHSQAILTEKDVLDIRFLYKDELERRDREGKTQVAKGFALELSEYYGVRVSHISSIGRHKIWKHLEN